MLYTFNYLKGISVLTHTYTTHARTYTHTHTHTTYVLHLDWPKQPGNYKHIYTCLPLRTHTRTHTLLTCCIL